MNISLSEALRDFAEEQASLRGFGTINDYVRELIRKDRERQALRGLLTSTGPAATATASYSSALQARMQRRTKSGTPA
jgi:antitoxin ParD1/3/4